MAQLLLNTIALDPNRWTPEKIPYYNLKDLLGPLNKADFKNLEVWHYHLSSLSEAAFDSVQADAGAYGIRVPIVGLYPSLHLTRRERDAERDTLGILFRRAKLLGASIIKIFAGKMGSDEIDEAGYARSISFMQELSGLARTLDLTITAETHSNTLCDTVEACQRFLADIDAPNLQLCYQPFDFADTSGAVANYKALQTRVIHLHLQGRKNGTMSLIQDADLDYWVLFNAFAAAGFDGHFCIEFVRDCVVEQPDDFDMDLVLRNARQDYAYVEKLAERVGIALQAS